MKILEDYIFNKKDQNLRDRHLLEAEEAILNVLLEHVINNREKKHDFLIMDAHLHSISELMEIFNVRWQNKEKFSELLKNKVEGYTIEGTEYYPLFRVLILLSREITPLTFYYNPRNPF